MLVEILSKAKELNIDKIYIFAHEFPDGDAIGSCMSLVEFFRNLGFTSKYVITRESKCLTNIFGEIEITTSLDGERFIAVICDSSTENICENNLYKKAEVTYKIDHHLGGEEFADYNLIVSSASANCEILWEKMRGFITPKIATYLYTGIYTDTGKFEFSLTKNVFLACADLVEKGADVDFVISEAKKIGYFKSRMMGYILSNYVSYADGILGVVINNKKREENRFRAKTIARCVNSLKDINISRVFFVACQDMDGLVYVELRSAQISDVDVSKIARSYGGGGHFHASGFTLNELSDVYKFIEEIKTL